MAAHYAIQMKDLPQAGSTITGYMPQAHVGDAITVITPNGLTYGTVIDKDLQGYVSPVQVADHTEPRDLGTGYVKILID